MTEINAISPNDGACAVSSTPAVHEHRAAALVLQQRQNFCDLRFARWSQATHGNIYVAHTKGGDVALFLGRTPTGLAQIEHGLNTDLGEVAQPLTRGLASTINMFVDLVEIVNSGNRGTGKCGQTEQ